MEIIDDLLKNYKKSKNVAEKLQIFGSRGRDVYNITAPFKYKNRLIFAGRVEWRNSEDSEVKFFELVGGNVWTLVYDAPVFKLQDPFWAVVNGVFVFGGVKTFPDEKNPGKLSWRTEIYAGEDFYSLEHIFSGPIGMKDLRVAGLPSGEVLVLTRPQGTKGGRGKIGYVILDSLKDLSIEACNNAPLLDCFTSDVEWVGGNAMYVSGETKVGVLGHIARFSENERKRHYYAMTFVINPYSGKCSDIKIIAKRSDFLPGLAKRFDLKDVVFSGGLEFLDEEVVLYAGTSDAEAQKLRLEMPF